MKDSDPMPLSGEEALTSDERLAFRKWLRDQQRVQWLGRQLKWLAPLVVSVAVGIWQAVEFINKHVHFK